MSARGQSDGRQNQPPPEAARLSESEASVINRVDGALSQHSKTLLGVASAHDFTTLPQELETLAGEPQTILTQFRGKKSRAQTAVEAELANAHTDYERAYRDYRTFRIQHGLTDSEPSYDNVFWRKVFWLALLFTIEVAANGWVIGQAAPGGLVEGWTTALMISVLVVLTGTLVGMGPWRYMNYGGVDGAGRSHRLWAIPGVVIGGLALLFFALYVAHYRFALSSTTLDAPVPTNILTAMASNPFAPFQQLESLMLFVIAILIGIFAVARGARWDDPYPGYGPRHRRMEEARERAQGLSQRLSHEIDQAKAEADEAMNAIGAKSQEAIGMLKRSLAKTQDNAGQWDSAAAEIVAEGRDAIDIYRNANRGARSVREPDYFAQDPFAGRAPPTSAQIIQTLETSLSRATGNITQFKSQLAGARAQLEAEYQSFYDDELTPFLRKVQEGAATRVRTEFPNPSVEPPPTPMPEQGEVLQLRRNGTNP
ncbi:MAG: hypothetical protein AB7J28_14110 [Hyphomonadaceae bacterium]